ncbi:hypothetical protein Bca4012_060645 [Brassica carinata]
MMKMMIVVMMMVVFLVGTTRGVGQKLWIPDPHCEKYCHTFCADLDYKCLENCVKLQCSPHHPPLPKNIHHFKIGAARATTLKSEDKL